MLNRIQLNIIISIAVVAWLTALLIRGVPVTIDLLLPYGIAVAVVVTALTVFDRYLWFKWPLHGLVAKRPYLHGVWQARLVSDYVDPETNQTIPPIDAYVRIHQTYSALSFRLYTDKSSSFLIAHAIDQIDGDQYRISTLYQNDPKLHQRGSTSEIHYGALRLEAGELKPTILEGHYWTDRGTRGTLTLTNRKDGQAATFEDAGRLFGEPPQS